MNKLIYIVDGGDGYSSVYKLETLKSNINDSRIKMSFYGDTWSEHVRGKKIVELKDHGNGVHIKFKSGTKLKLDYDEVTELEAILKFYNEDSECNQFISKTTKFKEVE